MDMVEKDCREVALRITAKAKSLGADLAGIVNLRDLQRSPSYRITPEIGYYTDGAGKTERELNRNPVCWSEEALAAVVIAIAHPEDAPEMDWWASTSGAIGNTEGNRILMRTMTMLAEWLESEQGIQCFKIPYNVEQGGVFMKDAAVLAGLGSIGKNNLLVTPDYGPRIRLRVMLLAAELPSTGILDFDPCKECDERCRRVCPQKSFAEQIYSAAELGIETLPGRNGAYNRVACNLQMVKNESQAETVEREGETGKAEVVKYCRLCEVACPVGLS